ncbi:MAG: hypothetical protein KDD70_11770, partial [Bdellovibrionales bacterium]|nr:hypothetical protein [Bdellovibrionales bacterium]
MFGQPVDTQGELAVSALSISGTDREMEGQSSLQLIFNGPKDESPETLRRLKGVFIAELDCSIDEVRRFLEEAPLVIYSTEQQTELQKVLKIVEAAGGIVTIAGNANLSEAVEDSPASQPAESSESEQGDSKDEGGDNGDELEFTFDLEDLAEDEKKRTSPNKVYQLEFDPDESFGPVKEDREELPAINGSLAGEATVEPESETVHDDSLEFTPETVQVESSRSVSEADIIPSPPN